MALIKSTLLAQISGSIAGTTFSHNRGGSYARSRALVSNPQSDRQNEVRTAMASLAQMWRESLTQAQRDVWNAYGSSTTVINRVGDSISLSGIAAFTRLNMFRVATLDEQPVLSPPPSADLPPGVTIPSYVSAELTNASPAPGIDVSLSATVGANFGLAVYYSSPLSPGITYFRGPYVGRAVHTDPGTFIVSVPLPLVPPDEGLYIATRITCFYMATYLPVWTVHQAPLPTPTYSP